MLQRPTGVHLRGIQDHMIGQLEAEEVAQLDAILAKLLAPVSGTS